MRHRLPLMEHRIAMEVIDFQTDKFGIELEAIISTISNKITNKEYKNPLKISETDEIRKLQMAIFDRIGLTTKIITDDIDAAIIPFYSNVNHVFTQFDGETLKKWLPDQTKFLEQAVDKQGFVDLKKVKLGGIFSEYENKVYINFKRLVKDYKLSPAEITAILLHELGHGFYICEYADRFESTNQVLANVVKEILSKKKEKNLTYIYKEIKKINPDATTNDIDTLVNGNRIVAGLFLYKTVIGATISQTETGVYDRTSFEQLADNFSTRFGYGKNLISGLEKLYGPYWIEKNRFFRGFEFLIGVLSFIRSCYYSFSLLSLGPFGVLAIVAIFYFTLRLSGEKVKDYTYDDLKLRYQRIRNQYVAQIKELELSNKDIKGIIESVHYADAVINETYQYSSFLSLLSNFLLSSHRQARRDVMDQQLLEQLTHNDLFLQSAHFKTLA